MHAFVHPQGDERERLKTELDEARDQARRRSLGNIKFIGELFKLKMLTEAIMHDCVMKLLKNHDEESLECLCRLLSTIGKDLDFEKAKVNDARAFSTFKCFLYVFHLLSESHVHNTVVLNLNRHDCNFLFLYASLEWISTSIRWTRSLKRERLLPESVLCSKTCWTSEK